MDDGGDRERSGAPSGRATQVSSPDSVARGSMPDVPPPAGAPDATLRTVPGPPRDTPPRTPDAETPDAETPDAGTPDAGAPDADVPGHAEPVMGPDDAAEDLERTTYLPATPAATTRGVGIDGPTTHLPGAVGGARPAGGRNPAASSRPPEGPPARRSGPPPGRGPRPPRGRTSGGRSSSGPAASAEGPLPGTMILERYRLVAEVGRDRAAGAALWKARDVVLERDVAVTVLTGGWQADARASSSLSRATRSAHFEHANAARVLDVVHPGAGRLPRGILGAAVAEWTPGRDLAELVARGPLRPSDAMRVVEPLAAAVAEAHRSGLVLGLDHPQRVRVGARASARLAFPMPRGDATVDDDVHGLGAALYLLLTGRWPSADGRAPAGLRAAPRTATGAPVPARQLRPDLPVELAALVERTLDSDGGIRTAAAVHRLIAQQRERIADDGVLLPVTEDGVALGEEPSAVWQDDDAPEAERDPVTRRKLRIGMTVLVLASLAIVAFVAFQLFSLVSGGGSSSAPPLVIPTSASPVPAPPRAGPPPAAAVPPGPPAPAGGAVQLSSVAVYDPSGVPDNPARVNRAVDNDPSTTWATSSYRQQLPALKPGVGVMTTFSAPSSVGSVSVRSPSRGTRIEIRSAPAADVPLSQTQVLGSGVLTGDQVVIPLRAAPPTGNLLIWITALGNGGGGFASELAEVTVQRAG